MRKTLTDALLRSSKHKAGTERYDDNGLVCRFGKKGRHTWHIRTRNAEGKYRRSPAIGYFPAMSLAEARAEAAARAERVRNNIPMTSSSVTKPGKELTVGELIDTYERARHESGYRIKSLAGAMRVLRNGLKPYLKVDVNSFTLDDLEDAHEAMSTNGRGINGNRFLAYTSMVLVWAGKQRHLRSIPAVKENFTKKIGRVPEKKRKRVLTMEELAKVWLATERLGQYGSSQGALTRINYGRMIRFLMLTGQRLGDADNLRHGHILGGLWRQDDNKSDRPQQLPLPAAVMEEIGAGKDPRARVFAMASGSKFTNYKLRKAELDDVCGFSDWRQHDLRRSFASQIAEHEITDPLTIESLLNHALPGVMGTYIQPLLKKQRREAMDLWAKVLLQEVARQRAVENARTA